MSIFGDRGRLRWCYKAAATKPEEFSTFKSPCLELGVVQAAGSRQQAAGSRQQAAGSRQQPVRSSTLRRQAGLLLSILRHSPSDRRRRGPATRFWAARRARRCSSNSSAGSRVKVTSGKRFPRGAGGEALKSELASWQLPLFLKSLFV